MPILEGIIVRTYPSREADLVIKVISKSEGKVALLAKHARKSTRRFAGGLDLFDRGTFETSQGRGSLAQLVSFSRAKPFQSLREDLHKLTLASLLCECFDLLVQEDATDAPAIYEILEAALTNLAETRELRESLRLCYSHISALLGVSGFHNQNEADTPSAASLLRLLGKIEACADKKLSSRAALDDLLAALKK